MNCPDRVHSKRAVASPQGNTWLSDAKVGDRQEDSETAKPLV